MEACFLIACKNSFFRADTGVIIDLYQFNYDFSKKNLKTFAWFAKNLYLCTRFRENGSTLAERALRISRREDGKHKRYLKRLHKTETL